MAHHVTLFRIWNIGKSTQNTGEHKALGIRLKSYINIFGRIAGLAFGFLVILSVSRLMLVGVYWDRVAPTEGLGFILLQGVRFDIILIGMLFAPVLLMKPWFHTLALLRQISMWLFPVYLGLVTSIAFFIEATTTSFIAEYGNRPNYLFVEYLEFPKEVFSMLAGSHLLELIALPIPCIPSCLVRY